MVGAAVLTSFGAHFLAGVPRVDGSFTVSILSAVAHHSLVVVLVLVFPALNGLFFYLLRAPTTLGRPVMDELAGLRMYIETAESGRLNIDKAPEITSAHFEALLPYAVALDVERPWANAFAAALARAHPGDSDPMIYYTPGWSRGGSWSGGDFGRSIASTVSAATGALAASMPRSSSGSSGFGGGGGSGGGGGGGGGGAGRGLALRDLDQALSCLKRIDDLPEARLKRLPRAHGWSCSRA